MVDCCVYLKVGKTKFTFSIMYVDDILLASGDLGVLHKAKKLFWLITMLTKNCLLFFYFWCHFPFLVFYFI